MIIFFNILQLYSKLYNYNTLNQLSVLGKGEGSGKVEDGKTANFVMWWGWWYYVHS